MSVRLSKHHAAGNDFLVLVDMDGRTVVPEATVRRLCDRRRGIGADGLVLARSADGATGANDGRPPAYEVAAVMDLFNADGSVAEMSGNGIRCLGQALWEAGIANGDGALVATIAGVRKLSLVAQPAPGIAEIATTMGKIEVDMGNDIGSDISTETGLPRWLRFKDRPNLGRACRVSAGNPHLVLEADSLDEVDLDAIGLAAQEEIDGGVNVEVFTLGQGKGTEVGATGIGTPGSDMPQIDMIVYERGVGRTLACGTGSCAAAAAARNWGLVGDRVTVCNPGGPLSVVFDGAEATLGGRVEKVAEMIVETSLFR